MLYDPEDDLCIIVRVAEVFLMLVVFIFLHTCVGLTVDMSITTQNQVFYEPHVVFILERGFVQFLFELSNCYFPPSNRPFLVEQSCLV